MFKGPECDGETRKASDIEKSPPDGRESRPSQITIAVKKLWNQLPFAVLRLK